MIRNDLELADYIKFFFLNVGMFLLTNLLSLLIPPKVGQIKMVREIIPINNQT